MVFPSFVSDRVAWRPALGGLALICALAACASAPGEIPLPVRTEYRATAWLRVVQAQPRILFDLPGHDDGLWSRDTEIALVKSRFVLSEALRKPGVSQLECLREEEDPLTWLKRRVEVRFLDNTEIMEIAVSGDDPSQLLALVNAVKDAYVQEVVGVDRQNALRRKQVLERCYHRNLEDIKKKTERLRELETELGLGPVDTAKGPLGTGESLAEIRGRVVRTRGEVRTLKRRIAVLKARLAPLPRPGSGTDRAGEKLPASGLQPKAAGPEPGLSSQQRHEIWQKAMTGIAPPPDTPRDLLDAIVAHLEIETGVLQEELDGAKADLEKAAANADQRGVAAELELRGAKIDCLREVTAQMGLALEKWEVELQAAPRVSVLEPATLPKTGTLRLQVPDWMRRLPAEAPSAKPGHQRKKPSKPSD